MLTPILYSIAITIPLFIILWYLDDIRSKQDHMKKPASKIAMFFITFILVTIVVHFWFNAYGDQDGKSGGATRKGLGLDLDDDISVGISNSDASIIMSAPSEELHVGVPPF